MKSIRTKAIVLRRTDYGEADRVLTLLTPQHGILSVMARGVRREKSRLSGGIELFATCDVTVGEGKGTLGVLTGARLDTFYGKILTSYDRLQFGYEAIKHTAKYASTIDEPAFFDLLEQAFAATNNTEIDVRITKAWFWLQLAIMLGVGVNLTTDTNGMKLVEDATYKYTSHDHGFSYQENGTFTSDHIKFLRVLSAQPPHVAAQVKNSDKLIGDCVWLAEQAVSH